MGDLPEQKQETKAGKAQEENDWEMGYDRWSGQPEIVSSKGAREISPPNWGKLLQRFPNLVQVGRDWLPRCADHVHDVGNEEDAAADEDHDDGGDSDDSVKGDGGRERKGWKDFFLLHS